MRQILPVVVTIFLRPKMLLWVLLVLAGALAGCGRSSPPAPSPMPDKSFAFQIRVFDGITQEDIQDANVTLELLQGIATKIRFTDATGHARFLIDSEMAGKPALLIVEKDTYQRFSLNVDLIEDQLPPPIPLIPAGSSVTTFPTETAAMEPIPTDEPPPTVTAVPEIETSNETDEPHSTEPPTAVPIPTETPDTSVATAADFSTIFAEPNASSKQIIDLNPGDKVYVIARTSNKSWFYILDIRGNYGYVAADRFDWPGEMDMLPVVTPEPVSSSPSTPNAGGEYSTLEIDFWSLPDGRCADGKWYRNVYIQGRGGDQAYTYYYFNDTDGELRYLAGRINQGYTFEVTGEAGKELRLKGEVRSGDGQSVRSYLTTIDPFPCP